MPFFGGGAGFPRTFGGSDSIVDLEQGAMLQALAPVLDSADSSANFAETYGHAVGLATIWSVNGRLEAQWIPARMLETLPMWEEAMRLRPAPDATSVERRAEVAAKFLGFAGNGLGEIYDSCAQLLGAALLEITFPSEDEATTYWPGINPGPPGFEWASNRALITIRVQRSGLSDPDFYALLDRVVRNVDAMGASWLAFAIGTDEGGFQLDFGKLSVTLFD
jgi:hypothetical protein